MKKVNYLLLLFTVIMLGACSNDDNNSTVVSFENMPVTSSYFKSTSTTKSGYYFTDTFQDNDKLLTFDHYYSSYGFAGFTYTNDANVSTANSTASIVGKAKVGTMYMGVYSSSYTEPRLKINNPDKYSINGCWVSNSVFAYNGMAKGDSYATKFKKDSWYLITATGFAKDGKTSVGTAKIYLAKYTSDTDTPSKEWLWFDLSSLKNAVYLQFDASSSDSGQYGMNTAANFCLDGITLDEK